MNILVYTSIYPIKGTRQEFTPVVKYFCEEWVKQGHSVFVVSSTSKFPLLMYAVPKKIKDRVESKKGFPFPNKISRKEIFKVENGVKIFQLPLFKIFPGEFPSDKKLKNKFQKIVKILAKENFIPDVAIGHWLMPQLKYLNLTKNYFKCKVALTLHSYVKHKRLKILKKYASNIDLIGFRSRPIQKDVNLKLNILPEKQYMCLSGVRDFFEIADTDFIPKKRVPNKIKICFVGTLIKRKHPDKIIKALNSLGNKSVTFDVHYVGIGDLKESINNIPKDNNINTFFHGRKPRHKVYNIIKDCDLMIMISKNEAYGLVYLEAMLNRTIPIASYNEGFDGIIKNEINGYLCNAGNYQELRKIMCKIISLDDQTYIKIQRKAFETARSMTDDKMANKYLKNIYNNNEK